MGPRPPSPILSLSTLRRGVTSAAVPVTNTSSAVYNISRGMGCSRTGISIPRARGRMVSRVRPQSSVPSSGGGNRLGLHARPVGDAGVHTVLQRTLSQIGAPRERRDIDLERDAEGVDA